MAKKCSVGFYTVKDFKKAKYYYEKAAEQKEPEGLLISWFYVFYNKIIPAFYLIAKFYEEGKYSFEKNMDKALEYYKKAKNCNYPEGLLICIISNPVALPLSS